MTYYYGNGHDLHIAKSLMNKIQNEQKEEAFALINQSSNTFFWPWVGYSRRALTLLLI